MNRREFLKRLGLGATVSAAALAGCDAARGTDTEQAAAGEIPHGKMTCRTNPATGDRVSLLGYGCMRWPTVKTDTGNEIDQETVNRLVDKAIEYGVNYFDTSPAYCKGRSERATGIALKRHPRDSYFIATKLSNFDPSTWSREASLAMYRNSFAELQTDRIDYLLLHGVGMGGMEALRGRYLDNGVLDFLLAEREAGRIRNLGFSYHGEVEVFDYLLASTTVTSGISCRSSSTTSTGATPRRSTAATRTPSTSTANWRSAASPPSSWSRCSEGASRRCPTTS